MFGEKNSTRTTINNNNNNNNNNKNTLLFGLRHGQWSCLVYPHERRKSSKESLHKTVYLLKDDQYRN